MGWSRLGACRLGVTHSAWLGQPENGWKFSFDFERAAAFALDGTISPGRRHRSPGPEMSWWPARERVGLGRVARRHEPRRRGPRLVLTRLPDRFPESVLVNQPWPRLEAIAHDSPTITMPRLCNSINAPIRKFRFSSDELSATTVDKKIHQKEQSRKRPPRQPELSGEWTRFIIRLIRGRRGIAIVGF